MNNQINSKMGRPVVKEGEKSTRERIFDAAIHLFSENGYDRTSVRDLASSLDLTEGAIYRHYRNKEGILDSIFEYAEKMIFSALPVEDTSGATGVISIFRGLLEPLPEIIINEPYVVKIMRIMFQEIHHNERIRKYYRKEYQERADDVMNKIFQKCLEAGSIKPCDTVSLARVFNYYRAEWAFQNFIICQNEPFDLEKVKKELNEIILFFEEQFLPGKTIHYK
ncbi:MAG TPA: TetR/AcrR family transcriptional regulator [Bacteroidales bacterium]|nr:TetR/AcrR family transcriptional regulator [Bacteroidales bacterium]